MDNRPLLKPIKNGWAAIGDGWAVHGSSPEEAKKNYNAAIELHRLIDTRPSNQEHHQKFDSGV